jgi:hypothetical protein
MEVKARRYMPLSLYDCIALTVLNLLAITQSCLFPFTLLFALSFFFGEDKELLSPSRSSRLRWSDGEADIHQESDPRGSTHVDEGDIAPIHFRPAGDVPKYL